MAEEKKPDAPAAAPAKAAPAAGAKKGGTAGFVILMVVIGAMVPFIYPTLFLLVGMLPTVLALFASSNDRQGSSIATIGAMNAAGLTPFVIELWEKGQTVGAAIRILSTSEMWVVTIGAAAVGHLILFAVPQAITSLTLARAEARIQLLKEHLDIIKAAWGPDVANAKPMEKVTRGS